MIQKADNIIAIDITYSSPVAILFHMSLCSKPIALSVSSSLTYGVSFLAN